MRSEDERNDQQQQQPLIDKSSDLEQQPTKKTPVSNAALLVYSGLLLFAAAGNSLFFKKMTNRFPNYPYFVSQTTTVVYVPIFFGLVAYQMKFTKTITDRMRQMPWWKFFVMGSLDSLAGVFMVFGGVKTSGSIQALLLQAVIPMTMILSYIVLKERYHNYQYGGAFIILVGLAFVLVPQLFSSDGNGSANVPLFNIIFLMSDIPQALSSVYKEYVFTEDMDVNYVQAWVAFWQLIFGFLLFPINSLKFLGDNYMPISEIPSALSNGAQCLAGINSIVEACGGVGERACDNCSGAWVPLVLYLGFNILYNVSVMLVIKHAGANLLYIVMTLRLPLVQVLFALKFINNPPDEFEWYSIVGLFMILGGLGLYRYASSLVQKPTPEGAQAITFLPVGGLEVTSRVIYVRDTALEKRMNPQVIRSQYLGRLGITGSPNSSHFKNSFRSSPNGSPGWRERNNNA